MFMIGAYLLQNVVNNAKRETDEKLGYGPHRTLFRNVSAWPKEFYVKDASLSGFGIVKKDYKGKIDAWEKERRKIITTNNYFFLGILLMIIGFGGLLILWIIWTYNRPLWNVWNY